MITLPLKCRRNTQRLLSITTATATQSFRTLQNLLPRELEVAKHVRNAVFRGAGGRSEARRNFHRRFILKEKAFNSHTEQVKWQKKSRLTFHYMSYPIPSVSFWTLEEWISHSCESVRSACISWAPVSHFFLSSLLYELQVEQFSPYSSKTVDKPT